MPPRKIRKSAAASSSSATASRPSESSQEESAEDSSSPKRQKVSGHWEDASSASASSLLWTGARSSSKFGPPSTLNAGRSLIQEASSATVRPPTTFKPSASSSATTDRDDDDDNDDDDDSDEEEKKKKKKVPKKKTASKRPTGTASSSTRSSTTKRSSVRSSTAPSSAMSSSSSAAAASAASGNELVVRDQQSSTSTAVRQQGRERPVAQTKNGVRQFVETSVGIRLFLQNCMSTVDLQAKPDLAYIATHARNADFNPKRFPAVFVKLREPKATALVFSSGKMVIIGAQNEDGSRLAAKKMARILQRLGFNVSFNKFTIQNLVGTGDVSFPIRLEGLADEHGRFTSYEPELFAGLVYRMQNPQVVLLIYVSGKVVITGARSRGTIVQAFERIYPVLLKYRKNPLPEQATQGAAASSAS
eukprot:gb/GECG01003520.1/.p1 GENE.gb/GECG01003520.1/~~gb/GECG01003520.1/.p1  ORF type:complete len:418 (+),score=62.23 gb/GECG01003520.1/:1-1254(+)